MEPSRCSALFMAALFSLYRCRFKDSIIGLGVLVIFSPLSGLLSIGVLVISFFLSGSFWLGVPMISFSSFIFALF